MIKKFYPLIGASLLAISAAGYSHAETQKGTEQDCTPVLINDAPCSELNDEGIPLNLEWYLKKSSNEGFFHEIGMDEECGETPCIFRADFTYWIHKKGWSHHYAIGIDLPIMFSYGTDSVATGEELYDRIDIVAVSLLRSLNITEVDVQKILTDELGHFKDLPRKMGTGADNENYVRLIVPPYETK